MKFTRVGGFPEAVPDSEHEEALCDWISVDVQNDEFLIGAAGDFLESIARNETLIGNRYKMQKNGSEVSISKSHSSCDHVENCFVYTLDEVVEALTSWKNFLNT